MDAHIAQDERGRRHAADPCLTPCPIERGMRILGGKWTGSILWHLQGEPVRFNDLCRLIEGASKKMVAERLRHLEEHGLVFREVRPTAPISVTYRATNAGHAAIRALDALRVWSERLPDPGANASAEPTDTVPGSVRATDSETTTGR